MATPKSISKVRKEGKILLSSEFQSVPIDKVQQIKQKNMRCDIILFSSVTNNDDIISNAHITVNCLYFAPI